MAALYSGWLKKKSPSAFAQWQSRFFVLSGGDALLTYYKNEGDKEPKGVIPLSALVQVVAAAPPRPPAALAAGVAVEISGARR